MAASSVDLGLDGALDGAIRDQWRALADAGLPSLADHSSDTNAPHVTLAQRVELPPPPVVRRVAARLPVDLTLAGLLVLPTRRGHVLARAVTPSTTLLDLHGAVDALLDDDQWPPAAHTAPGSWTPHVTLAAGLTPVEVAAALDVLPLGSLSGRATELRHWVPLARELTVLDGVESGTPGSDHCGRTTSVPRR